MDSAEYVAWTVYLVDKKKEDLRQERLGFKPIYAYLANIVAWLVRVQYKKSAWEKIPLSDFILDLRTKEEKEEDEKLEKSKEEEKRPTVPTSMMGGQHIIQAATSRAAWMSVTGYRRRKRKKKDE